MQALPERALCGLQRQDDPLLRPEPLLPSRIPFVPFFGDNLVPGSLYPDGLIEDLRDPQRSVNFGVSKTEAILDLMVNPKWLVPIGSMVDMDAFDNKVGGIIEYQMGKRPEPANFNDVPPSLANFVQENIERHNKISGYSDVARGDNSTSKAESGRMVALLSQGERTTREPEPHPAPAQHAGHVPALRAPGPTVLRRRPDPQHDRREQLGNSPGIPVR